MYCLQHLTKPRKPVMPKDKQQENGSTNVPSNQVNLFPNAKNIVERFSICIILRTHYDEPIIPLRRTKHPLITFNFANTIGCLLGNGNPMRTLVQVLRLPDTQFLSARLCIWGLHDKGGYTR